MEHGYIQYSLRTKRERIYWKDSLMMGGMADMALMEYMSRMVSRYSLDGRDGRGNMFGTGSMVEKNIGVTGMVRMGGCLR